MSQLRYSVRRCHNPEIINPLQRILQKDQLPMVNIADRLWWVVWGNGEPAGYAAMSVYSDHAWLATCGVLWAHRGRRLQTRLIDARVKEAKRQGLVAVYTYTINGNHASATSLIRCGFLPCTPPAKHFGPYAGTRDVLYWVKRLSK